MPEDVAGEADPGAAHTAIHVTANRIADLGILAFAPTAFLIDL